MEMNKRKVAKLVKEILDIIVDGEEKERHTAIMYQPVKTGNLENNDQKKSN